MESLCSAHAVMASICSGLTFSIPKPAAALRILETIACREIAEVVAARGSVEAVGWPPIAWLDRLGGGGWFWFEQGCERIGVLERNWRSEGLTGMMKRNLLRGLAYMGVYAWHLTIKLSTFS